MAHISRRPTLLEVRDESGVLQVVGSVDLTTAGHLRETLLAAVDGALREGTPVLLLDLSEAELSDAAGLGVLLGAHRRARRGGTRLRLIRLNPEVQQALLVSRLYRVLEIVAEAVPEQRSESGGAVRR